MSVSAVSPCLLAANQRLHRLREQAHNSPPQSRPTTSGWLLPFRETERERGAETETETEGKTASHPITPPLRNPATSQPCNSATLPPSLAHAILRHELAAPARIWLLLRHLDTDGRGVVSVAEARRVLTGKQMPLRVCGWRQLRNLLRAGEEIFWKRGRDQIWLRSVAKVAQKLGVERLSGKPVTFPLRFLLTGIGDVRAHFYATFHSARGQTSHSKPIARATLTALSGVGRSSQRNYEQRTGIVIRPNFALATPHTQDAHTAAWQQPAAFDFIDHKGIHGQRGATYRAWQLPNSYEPAHSHTACGRQRHINRKLADLLNQRATGNDKPQIDVRYCSNGREAARIFGRTQTPLYLQQPSKQFWHTLTNHQEVISR